MPSSPHSPPFTTINSLYCSSSTLILRSTLLSEIAVTLVHDYQILIASFNIPILKLLIQSWLFYFLSCTILWFIIHFDLFINDVLIYIPRWFCLHVWFNYSRKLYNGGKTIKVRKFVHAIASYYHNDVLFVMKMVNKFVSLNKTTVTFDRKSSLEKKSS